MLSREQKAVHRMHDWNFGYAELCAYGSVKQALGIHPSGSHTPMKVNLAFIFRIDCHWQVSRAARGMNSKLHILIEGLVAPARETHCLKATQCRRNIAFRNNQVGVPDGPLPRRTI